MSEAEFSEVIASARKRASERESREAARREQLTGSIRSRQEVLHTVVHRTLLQAWRDLEVAGVKASLDTTTNSRGEWQIALRIPSITGAPALVFSVIGGLAAHLVYSREQQTPGEEVDYTMIDDATPVQIAGIVSDYLSDTLG